MNLKNLFAGFLAHGKTPATQRTGEFSELEKRIGHVFRDESLLREALTHPSYKVKKTGARDYQRLEFLGDSVLGLVIAETLYAADSDAAEGRMSNVKSRLASGKNLALAGRALGIGAFLSLAPGGDSERIRETDTAHEDALEAVFGAVYLDGGLKAARALAKKIFSEDFSTMPAAHEETVSAKNRLQELVQQKHRTAGTQIIEYRTISEEGPGHAKNFTVEVVIAGEIAGTGSASSKKAASEAAARDALEQFDAE